MPNITAVKVRNRKPSRHKKIIRITVTGGEKSLHSVKTTYVVIKKPLKKKSTEHVHTEISPLQKTAVKAKYLMLETTSHNYNKLLISSTAAALFAAQGNKEF